MKVKIAAVRAVEGQREINVIRSATSEGVGIDAFAIDFGGNFSVAIHVRINDGEPVFPLCEPLNNV